VDKDNYADSEEKGYWSGKGAFKAFLQQLDSDYPGEVRVFAHSMGGIVVSEALLVGAPVQTYAACQTAVAAHAYGRPTGVHSVDRSPPFNIGWETPEVYANYPPTGAAYYDSIRSVIYNFYNPDDNALNGWTHGQNLKPNDGDGISPDEHYFYDSSAGQFYNDDGVSPRRNLAFPADTYEIYAHGAEARSLALGATEHPFISRNFNLKTGFDPAGVPGAGFTNSREDHSAQFHGTNMIRHLFWKRLIEGGCFGSTKTRTSNP